MSRSPDRSRSSMNLDSRHPLYESPTRYDTDFYIRKINRLENDMNVLQDELSSARVRLRRAEDFQIKYDMANRQNQVLSSDNDRLVKENSRLAVELDKLRLQQHEMVTRPEQPDANLLKSEIDHWKRRCEQIEQDSIDKIQKLNTFSQRSVKDNNKELQQLRRESVDKFERYEAEIRQLNRQLNEKQTVDKFVGAKVDRIKHEKDKEIARLIGIIDGQKTDLYEVIKEKNQEILILKSRYQKIVELELQNIHQNLTNQDEMFTVEIKGFRALLEAKNDQIDSLIKKLSTNNTANEIQKDDLKAHIKALTEALYKAEREAQLELYNIRERLTSIHAEDLKSLQTKHDNHITILKENKSQLQKLIGLKEQELCNKEKEMDRHDQIFKERLHTKDTQIKQLLYRINHAGETTSKELHHLHQSLHNITSEKQQVATGYLDNISFLDQQIKRLTTTLQVRNVELKNLEDLLSDTKRRCDQQMRQSQQKWKNERKQRQQERERLREEKQAAEEQFRDKQQAWRLKQKAYQSVKQKDGVEIDRLNCLVTELQKDVSRLNSYIKQLDDLLKKETRKSQLITMDTGGVRRELTSQLDRQQAELQNIKNMEIDQIKKKFELDIERISNDNKRLKSELLNRNLAYENLEEEFRKMESSNKILERINKDKLIEYQKKMAALNSEIYLTQNLYQSFMQAKSRLKKQPRA